MRTRKQAGGHQEETEEGQTGGTATETQKGGSSMMRTKRAADMLESLLDAAGAVPRLRVSLIAICRLAELMSTDSQLLGMDCFTELVRGQAGTEADARYNSLAGLCLLCWGRESLFRYDRVFEQAAEAGDRETDRLYQIMWHRAFD